MPTIQDDIRELVESFQRNKPCLSKSLHLAGLPTSFLDGWEKKLQRLKEWSAADTQVIDIDAEIIDRVCRGVASIQEGEHVRAMIERLTAGQTANTWVENVEYLLKHCLFTIRVCEGGGPENLLSSLVLTFNGMQRQLNKANK